MASCASCCAVASPPVRGAASLPPLEPAPPERASEAARSSAWNDTTHINTCTPRC